ncbi:MAG: 50S ribosomal protein L18 [Candidatus Harrisonbacteria bacterium]|nr:50S ribosomal protein L18 [Candidatus Harrisonbacteria bacterium]
MKRILKKNLNRTLRKNRSRARIFGTAEKPRLSVFRSNKYTYVQLIDDANSRTMAAASTKEIAKGKKVDLAKKLGTAIAEKAKKLGIKNAVLHRSSYAYHGRVKAVADGAREGGLKL